MTSRIRFKLKPEKLVETILYLARQGLELDQYKLVKLLYLADRDHFRRFRRPISFDRYVAMQYGPVASYALRLIKGGKVTGIDRSDLPFEFKKLDKLIFIERPKRDIKRDLFSKSDLMVLDQTVATYGAMGFHALYRLTHDHYAYDRAWSARKTDADEMRFEDFLDETADKEALVEDLAFVSQGI